MRLLPLFALLSALALSPVFAIDPTAYVSSQPGKGRFLVASRSHATPLLASSAEYPGVLRALKNLQTDIQQITQTEPSLTLDTRPASTSLILVGTLGKSPLIDQLVQAKKLDVAGISGKWETFVTQVIENPMPGVARPWLLLEATNAAPSMESMTCRAQMGVSPWNWWADVPTQPTTALYVYLAGTRRASPR